MTDGNRPTIYRQILKGTAVFGGTQILTMLANVVRGKFVALLLGDVGMGISSLLQSAIAPMQQLFSLGLPSSVVKYIAAESDPLRQASVVKAYRRILLALATLALIAMLLGAPLLSRMTFGTTDHTVWFLCLSVALFFTILSTGETAVLQGCRRLREYALCGVAGALCGLLIGVPLYYFYGIRGIVPSMIVLALTMYVTARLFTRRIQLPRVSQSVAETMSLTHGMLLLGCTMMLSALAGALTVYLLNTYLRSHGSLADVGLYQASCSLTLQATSLVFAAMAADYYPHLSSLSGSRDRMQQLVRSQAEVVVCVMAAVISLLILFTPTIVHLLLSPKFQCIIPLVRLIALSFWGRALCFPLDYVCMSKGDQRFFFWTQGVWSNVKTLLLSLLGYHFFGLIGLGYAALLSALIDTLVSLSLNRWRYGITYSAAMLKVVVPLLLLNTLSLMGSTATDSTVAYGAMSFSALLTCGFAYCIMRRRTRKTI